jgi:hypothetical protein
VAVLALTLGVYHWRRLGWHWRTVLAFVVVWTVLASVGAAVRSGIVVNAILIAAAVAAVRSARPAQSTVRRRLLGLVVVAGFIAGFFSYSSFLAEKRLVGMDLVLNPVSMERPDREHAMFTVMPERWHASASITAWYLSHSYARLAMALDMPFQGVGFGAGNSAFMVRNVVRLTGWERFEDLSYGMRLDRQTGHGAFGTFWATMYTWIASDVTFPGSVLVVFFLGYLVALAWRDVCLRHNALAVPAFACLSFLVFSLPMSNPLQDGPGITTFAGIPALWWITRSKYRRSGIASRVAGPANG